MEMPVPCIKCEEIVELNSTRQSPIDKTLVCEGCYFVDYEVKELIVEAETIQIDLDNYEDYMKGDRRGWKKKLKEIRTKVIELGFDFDDLIN